MVTARISDQTVWDGIEHYENTVTIAMSSACSCRKPQKVNMSSDRVPIKHGRTSCDKAGYPMDPKLVQGSDVSTDKSYAISIRQGAGQEGVTRCNCTRVKATVDNFFQVPFLSACCVRLRTTGRIVTDCTRWRGKCAGGPLSLVIATILRPTPCPTSVRNI